MSRTSKQDLDNKAFIIWLKYKTTEDTDGLDYNVLFSYYSL